MHTPLSPVRQRAAALLIALVAVFGAGCNDDEGGVPPQNVSRNLSFSLVQSSATRAQIGDTVTIDWQYANPTKLSSQKMQIMSLTLAGISTVEDTFPRAQRSTSFVFNGPITVVLTAVDRRGRAINAAFDIQLDGQYGFKVSGVQQTPPGFPRWGQRVITSTVNGQRVSRIDPAAFDIDFAQFTGIYEVTDNGIEDGRIDALQIPALRNALPSANQFFAHSFSVSEADAFGFRAGSSFPLLEPGYLLTADGGQFVGQQTRADAVVFGGKIAYDGERVRDRKSHLGYRRNVALFEPIFACVDLRSDAAGNLHVADVDLGNTNQGLVLSVFHGETLFRHMGTTAVNYTVPALAAVGEISGSIKGSLVGFGVTTSGGDILTSSFDGVEVPGVYASLDSIDWTTPFAPDTDLSGGNGQ